MPTDSELIDSGEFIPAPYRDEVSQIMMIEGLSPICKLFLIMLEVAVKFKDGTVCIGDEHICDWLGCGQTSLVKTRGLLKDKELITVTKQEDSVFPHYTLTYKPTDSYLVPGCMESETA